MESAALTIAQSAQLANYTFDKYISQPKHNDVKEIVLAGVSDSLHADLARLEVPQLLASLFRTRSSYPSRVD